VFRNLTIDSKLGKVFIEYSSRGELVPDQPTIDLWRQSIEDNTRIGRFHPDTDTLVLDGIPRNVHQAEMLKNTINVIGIFYLRTSDEKSLIKRLQRRALKENRLDDVNLEVIRTRLKTYEKESKPVLKFYGRKLVHLIDADQSPVKVLSDILRHTVKA